MIIHSSLTQARIVRAAKRAMFGEGGDGFCIACGRKAKQYCEPDAERYPCQYARCAQPAVYGAEQLLLLTVR